MDEQQIKDLIATSNAALLEQVNGAISGAVARTTKDTDRRLAEIAAKFEKPTAEAVEADSSSLAVKALQQKLEALEAERNQDKQAALASQRENAILSELGNRKLVGTNALRTVLKARYGDRLEQEGGKWFVKDGDTATELSSVVDGFLKSPDGLVFVPPASNVKGSGAAAGNVEAKPESPKTLEQQLTAALKTA